MTTKPKTPAPKQQAGPEKPAKAVAATSSAIYALHDPCTDEIRYIGKANNPDARMKSHMRDSVRRNTPVYCWIRRLRAAGRRPVMRVLEWSCDWIEAEKRLIAKYRDTGARLLNLAEGGNEPVCDRPTRARNGANVARERDKDIWRLSRRMGELLKWMQDNGRAEKAEQVRLTIELFGTLSFADKKRAAISCMDVSGKELINGSH